ncbi:MAG: XrtA/PEP-CTERM system TPR-repeat protein PrsT [Gammaproteobacteria bacterium]
MSRNRRSRRRRGALGKRLALGAVALVLVGGGALFVLQRGAVDVGELVERAQQHYEAGDLQASAIDLRTAITEEPGNAAARALLGRIYLDAGNPAGAAKELARARELGLTDPEISLGLTRAYLLSGKFDDAASEIALSGNSTQSEWRVLRGMLDLAEQRLGDARATFAEVLEAEPDNEQARRGLMQAELAAGNAELARQEVERLLETSEPDAGLWIIKGELDLFEDAPEQAQSAFGKALELAPENPIARIGLTRAALELDDLELATSQLDAIGTAGEDDPRVNFLRARIAEARDEPNTALRALRKVLQVAPMHRESLVMAARLHFGDGEYVRARDYVSRLLEIEPRNAAARRMLGAIQLAAGRTEALEAVAGGVGEQSSPADPGMLALLGTAYLKHGKFSDSRRTLERAAELAPDSLPIRTQLALSHLGSGDTERAEAELKAIMAEDPEFVQADIMLTLVHLAQKDTQAALEASKALRDRHPDVALTSNVYGYVLDLTGDKPAAREAYERALELDDNFHPARINLARMAIAEGDDEAGRRQFEAIIERDDHHPFALLGLAALALKADELDEAERLWLLARENNPDAVAPRLLLAKHYRAKGNRALAQTAIREAYELAPYAARVQGEYAVIMLEAGEFEEALEAAEALVERQPESVRGLELLAQVQNQLGDAEGLTATLERVAAIAPDAVNARVLLGRLAIRRGDFDEADTIVAGLLAEPASAAAGHQLAGDVRMAQDDLEGARQAYLAAFETAPASDIVLKLAGVERRLGSPEDRLSAWLEEHPDDLKVRLARASYMHQAGEAAAAVPEYERMLEREPENPVLLNNLAWLYHESGDERALELARRAHELAPQSPEIMDTYGWILFSAGQPEQGLSMLTSAHEAAPDNPEIGYHAASVLHATGQTAEARKRLETLLAAHPEFGLRAEAETLLAEISGE